MFPGKPKFLLDSVRFAHRALAQLEEKLRKNGFILRIEQLSLINGMLEQIELKKDTDPVGISYPCFMERGSGQTTAVVFAAIAIATHFKRKVIIISRPPPILSDAFKLADIDEESKPDISFDDSKEESDAVYIYDDPEHFMDVYKRGQRIMNEGADVYIFERWK